MSVRAIPSDKLTEPYYVLNLSQVLIHSLWSFLSCHRFQGRHRVCSAMKCHCIPLIGSHIKTLKVLRVAQHEMLSHHSIRRIGRGSLQIVLCGHW